MTELYRNRSWLCTLLIHPSHWKPLKRILLFQDILSTNGFRNVIKNNMIPRQGHQSRGGGQSPQIMLVLFFNPLATIFWNFNLRQYTCTSPIKMCEYDDGVLTSSWFFEIICHRVFVPFSPLPLSRSWMHASYLEHFYARGTQPVISVALLLTSIMPMYTNSVYASYLNQCLLSSLRTQFVYDVTLPW